MAGRRVALKAIDWLAFAERVPPNQRGMFNALKTRSDAIAAKSVLDHQHAIVLKSSVHSELTPSHYINTHSLSTLTLHVSSPHLVFDRQSL